MTDDDKLLSVARMAGAVLLYVVMDHWQRRRDIEMLRAELRETMAVHHAWFHRPHLVPEPTS